MHRSPGLLAWFLIVVAALSGCGSTDLVLPGSGTAADLRLVNGNNQTGLAGTPLALPLEVRVVDDRGNPVSGHTVAFALVDGDVPGARLDPETARSGGNGIAQSQWTLGATSGLQRVVARAARGAVAEPLEVQFTAAVEPGAASRIVRVSGDEQSAVVGTPLANPLVVSVTDELGNPVQGVLVNWAAEEGSVDPVASATGSDGRAQTTWTLGPATGAQSASASNDLDGSPIQFTATGLAGGAAHLERVSGDGQSGPPGTALGSPLVVRLLDQAGNGVPNRAVSWVVATGGGTTEPGTSITDDAGRASTQWTLGPGEGSNTLNAVVSGIGVVGFSATATNGGGGGGASRLEFLVQPTDTEEDRRISPPVEVVVLDQAGNRVTDREFEVKLELRTDGRGRLRGNSNQDTQAGVARFSDLEVSRQGEYRLRASADGLPSVDSDRFEVGDEDQGD